MRGASRNHRNRSCCDIASNYTYLLFLMLKYNTLKTTSITKYHLIYLSLAITFSQVVIGLPHIESLTVKTRYPKNITSRGKYTT